MELTEHNRISIAQIIIFSPSLFISIFLCIRNGFGRNAGWLLLLIFSLARLIGASLQLATINDPTNQSLYFGSLTLQSIGLSNLIIVLLALINRVFLSIEKTERSALFNTRNLRWAQIFVIIGVALSASGGPISASHYISTGEYEVSSLSEAGIGLTIAGFVLLVLATAVAGLKISHVESGEKRIVLAVAICLPFLLVRVIYSAVGTYNPSSSFNMLTGSIDVYLGAAVVEEIIIVAIIEAMGLTLQKQPKGDPADSPQRSGLIGGMVHKNSRERYAMSPLNQYPDDSSV
ncbi:hypothetical protein F4777DRAFT_530919 [Nemania sp. FL0916]|nr:hypothetical protein F4777DRAFT_530919 [Nemania sp. FL0916]